MHATTLALLEGKRTCVEIIDDTFSSLNKIQKLNCFITLNKAVALSIAAFIDIKLETFSDSEKTQFFELKPLLGAPLLIKDNIHVEGLPATAGNILLGERICKETNSSVARLINAGAIVIGKTNLDELANGAAGENANFGNCLNPHGEQLLSGGSSGGNGCIVGSGIDVLTVGSDTGGSVRVPASYCGLVGFRPSPNRYDMDGVVPISKYCDVIGPMALGLNNILLMDKVMSGCRIDEEKQYSLHGLRIGVPVHFWSSVEKDVKQVCNTALQYLVKNHGVVLVKDDDISDAKELKSKTCFTIAGFEFRGCMSEYLKKYHPNISYKDLIESVRTESTRDVHTNFHKITEKDYINAMHELKPKLQQNYEEYFKRNQVDLIVYPTTKSFAPSYNDKNFDMMSIVDQTILSPIVQTPSLSLPLNFDNKLPVGLNFDCLSGQDTRLLKLVSLIEHALKNRFIDISYK